MAQKILKQFDSSMTGTTQLDSKSHSWEVWDCLLWYKYVGTARGTRYLCRQTLSRGTTAKYIVQVGSVVAAVSQQALLTACRGELSAIVPAFTQQMRKFGVTSMVRVPYPPILFSADSWCGLACGFCVDFSTTVQASKKSSPTGRRIWRPSSRPSRRSSGCVRCCEAGVFDMVQHVVRTPWRKDF